MTPVSKQTLNFTHKSKSLFTHLKAGLTIGTSLPRIRKIKIKDAYLKKFKKFSYIMIILNCVVLCIDGPNFSDSTLKILNQIDFCFLLIFYIEVSLKVFCEEGFFFKFLNIVDFCLLLLNIIIQIYLSAKGYDFISKTDIKFYNLIRSLQLIRISRIMVSTNWKSISVLIIELIKILRTMLDFLCVLIIFLVLFTLIGRDLFKFSNLNEVPTEEDIIRINFDNFFDGFLANFLIFIGEEWHLIMFSHMKTFSKDYSWFFIVNVIFSTIFLNKIFLASLINNLIESKNMKKLIEGNYKKSINFKNIMKLIQDKFENITIYLQRFFENLKIFKYLKEKFCKKNENNEKSKTIIISKIIKNSKTLINQGVDQLKKNTKNEKDFKKTYTMTAHISSKNNMVKNLLIILTKNSYFSFFMIFSIIISLIILALHDPYQANDSEFNNALKVYDYCIFSIFCFELIADIIIRENGFFCGSIFFKMVICFLYLFYFLYEIEILKLLLVIRLFMIINFSKKLKLAFKALFKSLIDILQLFFFFLLVGILFALIGVKFFKGAFWFCDGLDEEFLLKVYTKEDCLDLGGDWRNQDFNFDNILKALEMVFMIANTEGWMDLM